MGTPADIYDAPATPFVCDFLGHAFRLETDVRSGSARVLGADVATTIADGPALAYVRSHDVAVAPAGSGGVAARLLGSRGSGASLALEFALPGLAAPVEVLCPRANVAGEGFVVGASYALTARAAHIFSVP